MLCYGNVFVRFVWKEGVSKVTWRAFATTLPFFREKPSKEPRKNCCAVVWLHLVVCVLSPPPRYRARLVLFTARVVSVDTDRTAASRALCFAC